MGADGWVAGISQPLGSVFYLEAGWPQWKALDYSGTQPPHSEAVG